MAKGNQGATSFVTKARFELLLAVAALFETLHLIGLFDRRVDVDGKMLAAVFTFGVPWIVLLLGIAVTRAGSKAAKWTLIILILFAVFSAVSIGIERWNEPVILLGAIAGIVQVVAVTMLLTPVGRSWTRASAN
ncbi:hypothetical protein [Sphingomonas sp. LT1P40]|uniref:hypothetical protein n=1 Tax=Alteristakelama amylovorans TaxID=3096166 RepID=UPI002FC9B6C8